MGKKRKTAKRWKVNEGIKALRSGDPEVRVDIATRFPLFATATDEEILDEITLMTVRQIEIRMKKKLLAGHENDDENEEDEDENDEEDEDNEGITDTEEDEIEKENSEEVPKPEKKPEKKSEPEPEEVKAEVEEAETVDDNDLDDLFSDFDE